MGLSFSTWPQGAIERCVALAMSLSGDGGVLGDTEIAHLKALARHELRNRDESEVTAFLEDALSAPELHAVRRTAGSELPADSSPLAGYGIDKLRNFEEEYRSRLAAAYPEFALPQRPRETPTAAGMSPRQLQSERAAVEGRIATLREWEKRVRILRRSGGRGDAPTSQDRSIGNTATRYSRQVQGDVLPAGVLTPEDVLNVRFQPTKHREGYDQDEVDNFLDEVVEELRWRWAKWAVHEPASGNRSLSSTAVLNARFQPTKHREGYDQDEVDDFLDRIVTTLRAFAAAGVGSGD